MNLKTKIAGAVAAITVAATLGIAPAANATYATTAVNSGSQAIVIKTMSGGIRTLYPGQSVTQAGWLLRPTRGCFTINGVHGCAILADTVWLSDGVKYIRKVAS